MYSGPSSGRIQLIPASSVTLCVLFCYDGTSSVKRYGPALKGDSGAIQQRP